MTTPLAALTPGAIVGVIAPAGPAPAEAVARVPALIESLGWTPKLFPGCHERLAYLAGDDDCRLRDLHAAFVDPDVAAIFCLRGGYGSGRLLDRIDMALVARHAKPLLGYSDITALHALLSNHGIASFHGPMPTSDLLDATDIVDAAGPEGFSRLQTGWRAGDTLAPMRSSAPFAQQGEATGRLVGGNLSIIASLLGTPWALDTRDAILFLEDIGEAPYRIDRLLLQLRLAGTLDAARGFVLGSFSDAACPGPTLREYLAPLGKPVLGGWPAGHCKPNLLLPLGVRVALNATAGTLTLLDDVIVPTATPLDGA